MKSRTLFIFIAVCLFLRAVPFAHAQLKLAGEKSSLTDTTLTPSNPSVLQTTRSPEIMAFDVPAMPSSGYALLSVTAVYQVNTTAAAPVRAEFVLNVNVSGPALPPGVTLGFGVLMDNFIHSNNGNGESLESGTADDTEALTRKTFADFLQLENSTLTADAAAQIAEALFRQGYHVSVRAVLVSRNITDATVTNPNVAFFSQSGSI